MISIYIVEIGLCTAHRAKISNDVILFYQHTQKTKRYCDKTCQ